VNLSIVLRNLRDNEGAKQELLKALEIIKRTYGEDHYIY
jgi:hypothetical protein